MTTGDGQAINSEKVKFREENQANDEDILMDENLPSYRDCLTRGVQELDAQTPQAITIDFLEGNLCVSSGGQGPKIILSQRIEEKLHQSWRLTVIVKLLDRDIGYTTLCSKIQSLWNPSKSPKVIDMKKGFFLVQFDDDDDLQITLVGDPWVVLGHYLTVQRWYPSFRACTAKANSVMAWIRLLDLPLQYYHDKIL